MDKEEHKSKSIINSLTSSFKIGSVYMVQGKPVMSRVGKISESDAE